jgi:hypothetical protein
MDFRKAEYLSAANNLETARLENAQGVSDLGFEVYTPPVTDEAAMYLAFDRELSGQPLSLYFEVAGSGGAADGILIAETFRRGNRSDIIRIIDGTLGLKRSGVILLYFNRPTVQTRLFGLERHWLKFSLNGAIDDSPRVIERVFTNTVHAVQYQKANEQTLSIGALNTSREFELFEKPVQNCEVDFIAENVTRWKRIESLTQAEASEEVYELDSERGLLRFGDGIFGKIPPEGEQNVRVNYTYGGGTSGNLAIGTVNSLLRSLPKISGVTNVTAMTGGTDALSQEMVELQGKNRFRHRFVPVSRHDFEEIVLEKFEKVSSVKCYSGYDTKGENAVGFVTLVVSVRDSDSSIKVFCREIYAYLAERCECNLAASGRLNVIPALELAVNIELTLSLINFDNAVETTLRINNLLVSLIEEKRNNNGIGEILSASEISDAIQADVNVGAIERFFAEGIYTENGAAQYVAIDDFGTLPYVIIRSGTHTIQIKV